ncbi:MAG: O-antigen ligase family protein [Microscillaceae bacterium]|nr:O-antigen ligase family protein [Microscillaceae bacterium]
MANDKKILFQTYFTSLLLLAFSLPFSMLSSIYPKPVHVVLQKLLNIQWNSLFVFLLIISWILEGHWVQRFHKIKSSSIIYIFFAYYFLQVVGLWNTTHLADGRHELLVKSTIIIFPLIFVSTSHRLSKKQYESILWTFCFAVMVASLFSFREGFTLKIDQVSGIPVLQKLIILHRPYLGMYIVFVIFFLFSRLFKDSQQKQEKYIIPILMYLLVFLLVIQSKMALMALFMTFLIIFSILLIDNRQYNFLIIFYALIFVLVFQNYPYLEKALDRFTDISLVDSHMTNPGDDVNNQARKNIWNCVENILNEKNTWFTGFGTGDTQIELTECYEQKGFIYEYRNSLNAHNEFLQETLRHGIPGFLIFLLSLGIPLVLSIRKKDYFLLSFILIICFCSLTESILSRQAGVVFYSFFNSLLIFKDQLFFVKPEIPNTDKLNT